jgi:DNA-binding transcriptional MerR regulator
MALIDADKPIIPLSSVAQMLSAKLRTLRMYEEKGLLPVHEHGKKLYSINDLRMIAFVHYLASFKKVNANGVRFVLELLNDHLDQEQKESLLSSVEELIEQVSPKEIDGEFEDF